MGNILLLTALIFLLLLELCQLVPLLAGLPYRPSEIRRARRALQLAHLRPGETLIDLGSGDGRVLFLAASEFDARALVLEIAPLHAMLTWARIRLRRLEGRATLRIADFNRADLSGADVVYAYITSVPAERLRPRLESQLKPGARVVAVSFAFQGWQPSDYDREGLIFIYTMPPQPGSLETYLLKLEPLESGIKHEETRREEKKAKDNSSLVDFLVNLGALRGYNILDGS